MYHVNSNDVGKKKIDEDGYDEDGFSQYGYDRAGYDRDGYDMDGYDQDGLGYDGYDKNGFDKDGVNKDGYDQDGYDQDGYDQDGYDQDGFDKNGFDKNGFDKDGVNKDGVNKDGVHLITKTFGICALCNTEKIWYSKLRICKKCYETSNNFLSKEDHVQLDELEKIKIARIEEKMRGEKLEIKPRPKRYVNARIRYEDIQVPDDEFERESMREDYVPEDENKLAHENDETGYEVDNADNEAKDDYS